MFEAPATNQLPKEREKMNQNSTHVGNKNFCMQWTGCYAQAFQELHAQPVSVVIFKAAADVTVAAMRTRQVIEAGIEHEREKWQNFGNKNKSVCDKKKVVH